MNSRFRRKREEMLGLLGKKIGMTQIYDKEGKAVPVTAIEAGPCFVIQIKTKDNDGYNAIQMGFGKKRVVSKPLAGHVGKAKVAAAPRHFREFRVADVSSFSAGQEINVSAFKEGDMVNVSGISIGKGFSGTVKRHHFNRGPMTHGSKSHRRPGSSGAGSSPGRVLPGTRRAGRLGAKRVTVKNLKVIRVDQAKNLLLVKGAVPGPDESILEINKAR